MNKPESNTNFLITLQKNKNTEISLNEFYSTHRKSISSFLDCFLKEKLIFKMVALVHMHGLFGKKDILVTV